MCLWPSGFCTFCPVFLFLIVRRFLSRSGSFTWGRCRRGRSEIPQQRETKRNKEKQRETKRDKERQRETKRNKEKERERKRNKDKQRKTFTNKENPKNKSKKRQRETNKKKKVPPTPSTPTPLRTCNRPLPLCTFATEVLIIRLSSVFLSFLGHWFVNPRIWERARNQDATLVAATRIQTSFPGFGDISGKKKAHKHKLFCPVGLGTTPGLSEDFTGFVPGTNPVKTWDKPGFSPYFTQWKPDFTGFVPGTNPVCHRAAKGGRQKGIGKKVTKNVKKVTKK